MIDFFGLFSIEPAYLVAAVGVSLVVAFVAVIVAIVASVRASKMIKKYESFMSGEDGKSIEKLIKNNIKYVKEIRTTTKNNSDAVKDIYEKLQLGFCKIGLNKYDAFHEMGGKLSFALCMLDRDNNGYLMNVMHSNNGCFAYVKEIVKGESFIELGGEEKKALEEAKAGRTGDASIGPKVNEMLAENVDVD